MLAFGYRLHWNPDELAPFAMWLAFPASDYYGASDALGRPWQTAYLRILPGASHVHRDGLDEIT